MSEWWLSGGIDPANCVAAYQAIGAESYAASKVNLASPGTNDAVKAWTNDPPWTTIDGWQFTGRDAANTLKAGTLVPRITWSAFVRVANSQYGASGKNNVALGSSNAGTGKRFALNPTYTTTGHNLFSMGNQYTTLNPPLVNGTMGLTGGKMWLDTTLKGNLAPTIDNITDPIYIGGVPNTGYVMRGDILAVAIYDTVLTDAQAVAVIEAMNALGSGEPPTKKIRYKPISQLTGRIGQLGY